MMPIVTAGFRYFLVAFAAGILLGTLRVLVLAPAFGPAAAVLIELPVILGIAWIACRPLARRLPATAGARLAMGGVAFVLLMTAEGVLGSALGRPLAIQVREMGTAAGLLGLAGQVAYALLPVLRLKLEGRPRP
jgi:hypothetical protein